MTGGRCRRCGQAADATWRTHQVDSLWKTAAAAMLGVDYSETHVYDVPVC